MPQTGAAGFGRSAREGLLPPPLASFDPEGEITVHDRRARRAASGARSAFDPEGEITAGDSRAATRAAVAEEFAARFGLDEPGPSAEALADRYDIRYEPLATEAGLPAGRRTITITGRGAERSLPRAERSLSRSGRDVFRSAPPRSEPDGFRGDRLAMWAVALALLLAFAAAMSAHAAIPH
jgi:hypothetical protein